MNLVESFHQFIKQHHIPGQALLIALSGGVDSRVVFELLLNYAQKYPLSFSVAHVNHGWRKESAAEAAALEALCLQFNIPFYLRHLDPLAWQGLNSEEICRNLRLDFFRELCVEHRFQAVLTGHHADDLAETVLKRLFESASLTKLSAMQPISTVREVTLWRPLLSTKKAEILSWALRQAVPFFEDLTNSDPKYLRGRLRTTIIPLLSQTFGKEIVPSLMQLSCQSVQLEDYLSKNTAAIFQAEPNTAFGWYFERSVFDRLHVLEQEYLIQETSRKVGKPLSRMQIALLIERFTSRKNSGSFLVGNWSWFVDRAGLFFMPTPPETSVESIPIKLGKIEAQGWEVVIEGVEALPHPQEYRTDWKDLLKGKGSVLLPEGEYALNFDSRNRKYPGKSPVTKWWSRQHVPFCLRDLAPLILCGEGIAHEFLTGRSIFELTKYKHWVKITIKPPVCKSAITLGPMTSMRGKR